MVSILKSVRVLQDVPSHSYRDCFITIPLFIFAIHHYLLFPLESKQLLNLQLKIKKTLYNKNYFKNREILLPFPKTT